jgi:hypothetical protein
MSIVIDILLVAVVVVFTVGFTRYGFARTAYKIGKTWLSLFISLAIGPWLSGAIEGLIMSGVITNGICDTLSGVLANSTTGYNLEALFEHLPSGFVSFLEHFNISIVELEAEYGSATEPNREMILEIARRIASPLASLISNLLGHIIGLVGPFFFFKWLEFKIRQRKHHFLRHIDHAFGCVVGLAIGCAIVLGASMLLHTIFQVIVAFNANSTVMSIYDNSIVFKFVGGFDIIGLLKQLFSK